MPFRPDAVVAKAAPAGNDFPIHPDGAHVMQCVDVIDLGHRVQHDPMNQKPPRIVPKVALVFASGEVDARGDLLTVQQELTVSMHEKSALRPFLERWRGKSYTEAEAETGAPLDKLCGAPAMVTVEHKVSKQGRTFANIVAISPVPKSLKAAVPDLADAYTRGDWWQKRIDAYADETARFRGEQVAPPPTEDDDIRKQVEADDDLPF